MLFTKSYHVHQKYLIANIKSEVATCVGKTHKKIKKKIKSRLALFFYGLSLSQLTD